MKKGIIILIMLTGIGFFATAKKHKISAKVMTLKTDRMGGANGAGVAWDPEHQKYYAAMSGNTYFPMFVYNADGKIVSDNMLETMFDVRGLWYNTTTKTLQTNGYKDYGLAEYTTDAQGIPESIKKLPVASKQPNEQCTGVYDTGHNVIYYYDYNSSSITRQEPGGASSTIELHLGVKKKSKIKKHSNAEVRNDYNENAIIYSGIPNKEIGLLNTKERQIELYNPGAGLKILFLNTILRP